MSNASLTVDQDPFSRATKYLLLVPPPILISFGVFGNSFAYFLSSKSPRWRAESAGIYLRLYFMLSVAILIVGAGQDWFCHASGLPFFWDYTDYACKLWEFTSSVLFYSPPWLLSALLADRYLLTAKYQLSLHLCNVFSAKVISAAIFVGLVSVSVHILWTFELHPLYGCSIPPGRDDFHYVVWPWISVIVYSFLPLLWLAVGGVFVIISGSQQKITKFDVSTTQEENELEMDDLQLNSPDQVQTDTPYNTMLAENDPKRQLDNVPSGPMFQRDLGTLTFNTSGVLSQGNISNACANGTNDEQSPNSEELLPSKEIQNSRNKAKPVLTFAAACMSLFTAVCTLPATCLNVYMMQAPAKLAPKGIRLEGLKFVFALLQMLVVLCHAVMPFLAITLSRVLREDARIWLSRRRRQGEHDGNTENEPQEWM